MIAAKPNALVPPRASADCSGRRIRERDCSTSTFARSSQSSARILVEATCAVGEGRDPSCLTACQSSRYSHKHDVLIHDRDPGELVERLTDLTLNSKLGHSTELTARHPNVVEDITVIVVNYRTLDVTKRCISSLLDKYPNIKLILIDNGSNDRSTTYISNLSETYASVETILNTENRFHGPALNQGVHTCSTSFVFTLDSDCEIMDSGFLERMLLLFDSAVYAVGKQGWTNKYGYAPLSADETYTEYVHPFAMLLDRQKYTALPPFVHHGAPAYKNMWGAKRHGYETRHFPIEDFILHHGRATVAEHGYGLSYKLKGQAHVNALEQRLRRSLALIRSREQRPPKLPPPGRFTKR